MICLATCTLGLMVRMDGRLAQIPFTITLKDESQMTQRTTTWTSALGAESITTTKGEYNPAETTAEWRARHRAEVIDAQKLDPPV